MPDALWLLFDQDVTHLEPYPFASLIISWGGNFYTVDDLEEQHEASRQLFTTLLGASILEDQLVISDPTGFYAVGHPELPLLPDTWLIPYP